MAGMDELRARWQEWATRFAALQPREKHLIIGALAVGILFGGFTVWVEPAQLQAKRLKATLAQQAAEQEQLSSQIAALAKQKSDPDAANRAALQQFKEQLASAERGIKSFDRVLVTPRQAPALLQTLLARHRGLSVVSFATLAPQPLIEPPVPPEGKEKAKEGSEAYTVPGGNIYKHGIEIRLTGSYLDLLAYVAELEASPQKLLWGRISFDASKHPVTEMSLIVYSLSLESTWLVV